MTRQANPGLRHLIGATVLDWCFRWRFAAHKYWPDAFAGNTSGRAALEVPC